MKKSLSTIILSSLLLPSFVFALTPSEKETSKRSDPRKQLRASSTEQQATSTKALGFCAQIDKAFVYLDNKAVGRGEKNELKTTQLNEKNKEIRKEVDTRHDENDMKRKNLLDELARRATTTEQKAALATFTASMNKALADKKIATNALITEHKNEVTKVTSTKKVALDKALATLTADINAAKAKATADCKNNVQGDVVRKDLKDSLQKAQEKFNATILPLQKNASTTTSELKKKDLQTIEDTFKKSIDQAKNELRASFITKTNTAATTH